MPVSRHRSRNAHHVNGFVAQRSEGLHWERLLFSLEFLQTNHVWFRSLEPGQEILQPLINVIDIEGSDFHREALLSIIAFANAKR